MVVPNKKLEINENLMIVVVAVGSFMLLDTLCPNKKSIESMQNIIPNDKSIHAPVDMDLEVYSGASMQYKSEEEAEDEDEVQEMEESNDQISEENDNRHSHRHLSESEEEEEIHEFIEEHEHRHKHSQEEFQRKEEEIDNRIEEELGCDCSDEIKKIRDMFTSEVKNIKRSNDKIKKDLEVYKRKYEREKNRNNTPPEEIQLENSEEEQIYDKSGLNKTKQDEWNDAMNDAKKLMNIKGNISQLKRVQKIKLIRKASELMIRKEIMKSLGVINVPYNQLKSATRNKIDRMTLKAMELEDSIINSVLNTTSSKKQPTKSRSKRSNNYQKYNPYNHNNPKNPDDIDEDSPDNEDWNDLKYSELNPKSEVPLGSYDKTFTDKWDQGWTKDGGYVYLNTDKWKVPLQRPPICVTNNPSKVFPSITSGYPVDLMEWHESNKIENGHPLNTKFINDKINAKLNPNKPVYRSN